VRRLDERGTLDRGLFGERLQNGSRARAACRDRRVVARELAREQRQVFQFLENGPVGPSVPESCSIRFAG